MDERKEIEVGNGHELHATGMVLLEQAKAITARTGENAQGMAEVGELLRGFLAWWARRTYYLFQMPRFSRRVRIVADWTLALCFRPDIVKVDLASERAQLERDHASGAGSGSM